MDVHFTGFLFDFFGLILADAKAAFFRRTPRDRRERGLPLRLIQVVFSDAAYGFLWRKNGYAFFWLRNISFIMGKNTQKAIQHWRNAAIRPPMASPRVLYSQG